MSCGFSPPGEKFPCPRFLGWSPPIKVCVQTLISRAGSFGHSCGLYFAMREQRAFCVKFTRKQPGSLSVAGVTGVASALLE